MNKRLLCCFLLYLPIAVCSAASQVTVHTLKNGLKVLVKEDHRSPVVVSQIWYKVGSSYEPDGITGISHMLEHMMFKGTDKHPQGEFSKIIASHGGDENAFTSQDYTAYFQTMAADKLEVSFELEADRMRNLHLLAEELKKELEVVTEERRMRIEDNPQAKLSETFDTVAFTSSPYDHPVIGWPSDIANYKVEDLQAWYSRWYAPNNAVLVVVGDVDAKAVIDLAEKHFGSLQPSDIKPLKPQPDTEQLGRRQVVVKAPAKMPVLLMGYKVPSLKTTQDESEVYALEVLAGILDGGNSARLTTSLVRGKQLAVSVDASYDMASRLDNLFQLSAIPVEGKTHADLEAALKAEVNKLQQNLVSPDELKRIKAQVLANEVYGKDSNFNQAMQLGALESVGLPWQKADEYVDKINQVTAEQVQAVAKKYLIDDHLTVGYLEPIAIKQAPATKQETQTAPMTMKGER